MKSEPPHNYPVLEELMEMQIEAGSDIVVIAGCTGAAATMTPDGQVELVGYVNRNFGRKIWVISGDDGLTLEIIKNGGTGVISVTANIAPGEMKKMVDCALYGKYTEAEEIDRELRDLYDAFFGKFEGNPDPASNPGYIQFAPSLKGYWEGPPYFIKRSIPSIQLLSNSGFPSSLIFIAQQP